MAQPTNWTVPTGGVIRPIPWFSIITMPNWTGSMPASMAMGRKIGVVMITRGAMSMKVPSTSRMTLIINRVTIGLSDRKAMISASRAGASFNASSQPKAAAVPMISMIIAVVFTEVWAALRKSRQPRVR